eukprot:g14416.t1
MNFRELTEQYLIGEPLTGDEKKALAVHSDKARDVIQAQVHAQGPQDGDITSSPSISPGRAVERWSPYPYTPRDQPKNDRFILLLAFHHRHRGSFHGREVRNKFVVPEGLFGNVSPISVPAGEDILTGCVKPNR